MILLEPDRWACSPSASSAAPGSAGAATSGSTGQPRSSRADRGRCPDRLDPVPTPRRTSARWRELNRHLGALPLTAGQRRRAAARLRGLDRARWRPRSTSAERLRPRRVLHHRLGRRDRPALRGAGRGRRARGHGPAALRPPRLARHPRLQGLPRAARRRPASSGTRCCRSSRSRARCAGPTCATTARSSSSTDGSASRVAEPHRARLQQAQEPRGRPRVGRADGRGCEGPVVAALDAVFATDWFVETGEPLDVEPCRRRRRAPTPGEVATSPARWCRADPASWPRTTCGCSPR